ncbi:TonB-dependent siderophore receptor [Rosenbergiella collisarenosi]|uniref:TonB-dependent siderophore receptor n=3 Tax=Rosenbergiella TaxID=1356488 RepID=UPI001BD98570|nr:TonB-dependent siderophore receptor [Rosenbergiella collisarenosi]MBT0720325.1 TonB-dependent siderophore receptor [Rosenbergiella collisarenosi]
MKHDRNMSHYKRPLSKIWLAVYGGALVSSAGSYAAESTDKTNNNTLTVTANKTDDGDGYSSPTTSIASKTPTSKLDEAQSVSVVTQQQLQDFQTTTVSEAMRFVSGTSESNTLGQTEDGIIRRGFGLNADGSVFRDGIRSSEGLNFDQTTDHVEVLKGSSSLLYGILNPGGMINVVSKKPEYQWRTIVGGHYNGTGGGAGNIDITGPLGNGFAFRFIAEKQDQDYWRSFGNNKHTLLAPSLQWYGEKASFNITYENYQYDIPYDRGTAFIKGKPVNIGYKTRLDDYSNRAWGRTQTLSSHWDYQFNDTWSTRITGGFNQRKYNSDNVTTTAVNTTTGVVTRRADAFRGFNHQTKYLSWDMIGTPKILGMTHNLVVGTDYEMDQTYRAHAYNGKKNSDFTLDNPVYGLQTVTDSTTEKSADKHLLNRVHNHSIYLKDNIELTQQWILVAGARYQHYEQRETKGIPTTLSYDDEGNKFLPQAGLVYKLTPDVSFYGSMSKSFTPSTNPDDNGNIGAPEEGTSYEVGSKWQLTPSLLATVALYRIDERNLSLYLNGDTYAVDKARSTGVEFELNGEIYPGWDFSANYSHGKAKIVNDKNNSDNNGNLLQNAPQNSGGVYLSHNITIHSLPGSFRLGGGVRYMGTRAGDPDNSFSLPAYTVADTFIGWDNQLLGKKTHLQLNLNNLFNKHYYTSSGGNLRVSEGQTRNVVLSASVEF